MNTFEIFVAGIAVFGSAVISNGVAIGAGIFILATLSLVCPTKEALAIGAPVMLLSGFIGVKQYWKQWDTKVLILLLPFLLAGVACGAFLIKVISDEAFRKGVGIFALICSGIEFFKMYRSHFCKACGAKADKGQPDNKNEWLLTVFFGFFTGIAATVANAGGLAISLYMIRKNLNTRSFVATMIIMFLILHLFKIVAYFRIGILNQDTLFIAFILAPCAVLGSIAGNFLNKKIPPTIFNFIVVLIIFIAGLRLI